MKETVKNLLSRLLQFVICNLAVLLIGAIVTLILGMFAFEKLAENSFWYNFIFMISMAIGLVFPFCSLYFLNNSEYKRFYLKNREEGHSANEIMRMHAVSFGKYEFLVLLIMSLALSPVPTAVLGKIGVSFIVASAGFFTDFIPLELLQNTSFVIRLLGWLLWDAYIAGLYFVCLRISYRIWEKSKLRK